MAKKKLDLDKRILRNRVEADRLDDILAHIPKAVPAKAEDRPKKLRRRA